MQGSTRRLDPRLAEISLSPFELSPIFRARAEKSPERPICSRCVAVLIEKRGSVVLIEEDEKRLRLGFPGGTAREGESHAEAAIREVKEEINIDVEPNDIPLFEMRVPDHENPSGDHQFIVMLGRNPRGRIKRGIGVRSARWYMLGEIPLGRMLPKHRRALEAYRAKQ